MEVHRQYDLRSKKNEDNSKKNNLDTVVRKTPKNILKRTTDNTNTMAKKNDPNKDKISQPSGNTSFPSTSTSGPEKNLLSKAPNKNYQIKNVEKFMADKNDVNVSKTQMPFSLKGEIAKIKINIPLAELVTREVYKSQVLKALNIHVDTATLNLTDDKPELLFGPMIEGKYQEGVVPPFYVSLNIHDKILHNAMLDAGASHNLMPKVVIESLGLEITRPYKDLYSFDSRKVKCLGLVKDLCVNLSQILFCVTSSKNRRREISTT